MNRPEQHGRSISESGDAKTRTRYGRTTANTGSGEPHVWQWKRRRQNVKIEKPFQKIPEASRTTGLSQFFLRNACRDGTCPHVMSGGTYYVNIPALLRQLGVDGGEVVDAQ